MKKFIVLCLLILCFSIITGCSTEKSIRSSENRATQIKTTMPGFYHSVKTKETLWSISHIYSVDMNELADFNNISNACRITTGQKIFIPDSFRKTKEIKSNFSSTTSFDWPYKGELASCFNELKKQVKNQGIDIITKPGASIKAAEEGNVIFTSTNMRGFGKTIIIKHNDNFSTIYANNHEHLVKTGDYVKKGQPIAYAGSSGRTTRPAVHFELRKNSKAQNPLLYLP